MTRVLIVLIGVNLLPVTAMAQSSLPAVFDYPSLLGQVVILVTTILGFIYTVYRENRNRRWDLEDRRRIQSELAMHVAQEQEKLATVVAKQQERLATKVAEDQALGHLMSDERQQELLKRIDENTEISKAAHKEANDINQKFAKIAEAYDRIRGRTTVLEEGKADKS